MYNIPNWKFGMLQTYPPPLRWISAAGIRLARKKEWGVLAKVILSFPCGFVLGMVAPLNFAKLNDLAAGDSTSKLQNLDWLLLISCDSLA